MAGPNDHESHDRAQRFPSLWVAVVGWTLQTLTFTLFSPGVDLSTPAYVFNIVMCVVGTVLLGGGIAQIAAERGHSRMFAVLACVNLAGLILVGLLPPLGGGDNALTFQCPHCQLSTRVDLAHAGQEGPCRGCGRVIRVPGLLSASDVMTSATSPGETPQRPPDQNLPNGQP